MKITDQYLIKFVTESNAIEGIRREPLERELVAHLNLWNLEDEVKIQDLKNFVKEIQPNAVLRQYAGPDVRIGNHIPIPGGPKVKDELFGILNRVRHNKEVKPIHPYLIHLEYETLHPFTDGNGRSGRALWAWQMLNQGWEGWGIDLGFLHAFYYQTLQHTAR